MLRKFITSIAMIILFTFASAIPVQAVMRFSVHSVLPDNQVDPAHDFFHVQINPGEEQTLEIILNNPTDEEIVALVDIATATTNNNGVVEYITRDIEPDSSLRFKMEDIISGPSEIVLPPNEQTSLFLDVQMPNESFDGVLAGGITFLEKDTTEEEVAQGMMIVNQFAFTKAIILRNTTEGVPAEFVLNEITPFQQIMRTNISANIQNISPRFVNGVFMEASVREQGSEKVLFSNAMDDVQFAPNSNFDFIIPLEANRLEAGTFIMDFVLRSGNDIWEFSEEFVVEAQVAREFNENNIYLMEEPRNWLAISLIAGGAAVLIGTNIATIVYFKKRK